MKSQRSVSYTHLDVYKRQADGVGPVALADEFTAMPFNGMLGSFDHVIPLDRSGWETIIAHYPNRENTEIVSVTHSNIEGCVFGKTHKFWITCLYQRANPSTLSLIHICLGLV